MNEDLQRLIRDYLLNNIDTLSKAPYDYTSIWRGYIGYPL